MTKSFDSDLKILETLNIRSKTKKADQLCESC